MPDPNATGRGGRGRGRGPRAITQDIVAKTGHEAVRRPGSDGSSVNALEVRVMASTVEFVVNGTVVHTANKADLPDTTDGIVGFRVNHRLNVQVTNFGVNR